MQHRIGQRTKRILFNETGQMTVFVALIFQVLFVFFAMVINIGLIVHDKINLQNAVDLGAYYGAQRQAEILNEIAHVNYQIRQDYKLLTWRYRVLGTLGRGADANTPGALPPALSDPNQIFVAGDQATGFPSVCVANPSWREALKNSSKLENYCYQEFDGPPIPSIPLLPVFAPFFPFNDIAAAAIAVLKDAQGVSFGDSGPWNWAFAAQIMQAYKLSIASRKAVIQRLRKNLVAENFVDQNLQSVSLGVLTTIKKNLTLSNASSFQDDAFQFSNGLANPNCAGGAKDGSPTIVEIRTAPTLLYTYPKNVSGYTIDFAPLDEAPRVDTTTVDPLRALAAFTQESETPGLDSQEGLVASSLGFEKNPWCMAYIGVRAKSHPRKPFAPFGQSVTLEARAFAQPFGGRVGPWYSTRWSQSSDFSDGPMRTDLLTSPRLGGSGGAGGAGGLSRLPNYSRYPGDTLGLTSKASQAAERNLLKGYNRTSGQLLSFAFYSDFARIPETGDPLAWDASAGDQTRPVGNVTNVRQAEVIAVSPDVFDITYYSIDLYYGQNYKSLNASNARFPDLPSVFGLKITVPPDLGGRNGIVGLQDFSVTNQFSALPGSTGLDPNLLNAGLLPFYVLDQWNVLTGWAPNAAQNYSFPGLRYGRCSGPARGSLMIPGGCAQGGRTGYSVRLLSRDHLINNKWSVGGDGESPGGIRNPPQADF